MLPRLILIADRFTLPDVADVTIRAADAGAPWVVLRERTAERATYSSEAISIVSRLRALPHPPLISITADLDCARHVRTHFHVGAGDVPVSEARRRLAPGFLVGYSAHSEDEVAPLLDAASPESVPDYLFFSPIFPTLSKPGAEEVGLDALARFVQVSAGIPVFALGGIDPPRVTDCLDAGAYGVAVLSGILRAPDVQQAVDSYRLRFAP